MVSAVQHLCDNPEPFVLQTTPLNLVSVQFRRENFHDIVGALISMGDALITADTGGGGKTFVYIYI